MKYLSFNAATIAKEYIGNAIKQVERGIESCGALTHQDSRQSDSAKEYFGNQLESLKQDVECLKRLSAELGNVAYEARTAPSGNKGNDSGYRGEPV